VIVVDNNSTDATAELARRGGARVVFEPVNQIARARNAGAA
jgi:glycosyltransferase involved in cell wall biosynthesis